MKKQKTGWKMVVKWAATVALGGVIVYCGLQIETILGNYRQEAKLHEELLVYKPEAAASPATEDKVGMETPSAYSSKPTPPPKQKNARQRQANQSILDLRKRNADVVGWISVPGTEIEYPFVQANDNSHYLGRNIDGKYAAAGTVFLDYRCNPQFLSFNHYLYGHHMKNGSMFGTLNRFDQASFFDDHPSATLYLDDRTHELEIFAYMVVTSDNAMIYDTVDMKAEAQAEYFNYIAQNARRYRDIGLASGDRIVTLSTCAYEFNDARMVLLARIMRE